MYSSSWKNASLATNIVRQSGLRGWIQLKMKTLETCFDFQLIPFSLMLKSKFDIWLSSVFFCHLVNGSTLSMSLVCCTSKKRSQKKAGCLNSGSDTKIPTSLYKWAWIILARDTETLVALTYSMANRCEAIIATDGMQKISNSFRLLTLNPWSY